MTDESAVLESDISALSIDLIRLTNCQYSANDAFTAPAETQLQLNFGFLIGRHAVSERNFVIRFSAKLFPDVPEPPFRLTVEFEGRFSCKPGGEKALAQFVKYGAISMLVPYVRQVVTGVVSQSGYNPVTLPIIDVVKLVDDAEAGGAIEGPPIP